MTSEQFDETGVTVGLLFVLFEGAFVQLFHAEHAHKVFRVESFASHGCNAPACDWLRTPETEGTSLLVVVQLTVGVSLELKEVSTACKLHIAFL